MKKAKSSTVTSAPPSCSGKSKTAIRKILIGGQSYQIGSRKLTRADLYQLRKLKEELEAEIAAEGDTSLLDNTYVAFFDGR